MTAPESTLPYPPVYRDKKFIVLTDWDGTITTYDSNDYLTDHLGFGKEKRREGNLDILAGKATFRDTFKEMLDSVAANGHTFEECKEVLKQNIQLDPGFKPFYKWCRSKNIPVIIVSSGMAPIIRHVLSNLVGEDEARDIQIISNDVQIEADGKWQLKFRHPSSTYGHDKSHAILPYRQLPERPTLFFFGDGVSDMSAARHADLLFVKTNDRGENDLAAYCVLEGIKHALFDSFSNVLPVFQTIVNGERSIGQVLEKGNAVY